MSLIYTIEIQVVFLSVLLSQETPDKFSEFNSPKLYITKDFTKLLLHIILYIGDDVLSTQCFHYIAVVIECFPFIY